MPLSQQTQQQTQLQLQQQQRMLQRQLQQLRILAATAILPYVLVLMLSVRFLATIIANGVLDTTAGKDVTRMQTAQWIDPYVQTTPPLQVVLPAAWRRPISGVVVLSTLTVSREKSVRVQSVWRDAGRTQLVLAGTLNANRGWRAASFVKTCNVLKVVPTIPTARVSIRSVTRLTIPIAHFVTTTTALEVASTT